MCTDGLKIVRASWFLALLTIVGASCGCNQTSGYMMNRAATRYHNSGNYAQARSTFQRAVADSPQNAGYIHNLATAMRKQGDLAGAERTYRHALNVDPAHQPSYHSLVMLLNDQGRQHDASGLLQTWVDTQPYIAEPHIEMAWFKREQGDTVGAERSLMQALQVRPNHHIATAHLGQLYQDTGQRDRALAMYQRSLHKNWFQPHVQSRVASMGTSPTRLMNATNYVAPTPQYAGTRFAGQPTTNIAQYGTSQRVAMLHPLPTYSHATNGIATSSLPIFAQQPIPATTIVQQPIPASGPILSAAPPGFNPDPAHVPRLSADVPQVQPY